MNLVIVGYYAHIECIIDYSMKHYRLFVGLLIVLARDPLEHGQGARSGPSLQRLHRAGPVVTLPPRGVVRGTNTPTEFTSW